MNFMVCMASKSKIHLKKIIYKIGIETKYKKWQIGGQKSLPTLKHSKDKRGGGN